MLAGQYVRLRLEITGKVSQGTAHYEQRKGQDIVVATFEHALDAAGEGGNAWRCYRNVRLVDFDAEPPRHAALDEGQLAAQQSRVLKRRSLLERRLAGEGTENRAVLAGSA